MAHGSSPRRTAGTVPAPTPEQASLDGATRDAWLYGLYEGVPASEWGADMVPFPNKITLFQLPLETDFHELAHHAGIDDDRLRELDYD